MRRTQGQEKHLPWHPKLVIHLRTLMLSTWVFIKNLVILNFSCWERVFHWQPTWTFQESFSDDSDLDERIMQHLAAASSRARYARRRERQRSSGLGPSRVFVFSNHESVPGFQQTYPTSPEDSPTSQRPSIIQSPLSFICSTAANSDIRCMPRFAPKAKSYSLMWTHINFILF